MSLLHLPPTSSPFSAKEKCVLQERRADLKIPEVDSFPPKTKLFLSLSFFAWEVGSLIFPIRETEILKHPAQYLAFNKEPHQCHCLDHLPFKDASCSGSQALLHLWELGAGNGNGGVPLGEPSAADLLTSQAWTPGFSYSGAQVRPGTYCSGVVYGDTGDRCMRSLGGPAGFSPHQKGA